MKLGDIYKHKENDSIIQIDSFASHMGDFLEGHIIVFTQIEKHSKLGIGSCPSFNGYGSQEEIENEKSSQENTQAQQDTMVFKVTIPEDMPVQVQEEATVKEELPEVKAKPQVVAKPVQKAKPAVKKATTKTVAKKPATKKTTDK